MAIDVHLHQRGRMLLPILLLWVAVGGGECLRVTEQQDAPAAAKPGLWGWSLLHSVSSLGAATTRNLQQSIPANSSCPLGCDIDAGGCFLDAATGAWKCRQCMRTMLVSKVNGTCICPMGRFASKNNTCADCTKGFFCPGGSYTESEGNVTGPIRIPCPENMTTMGLRSINNRGCVNLPGYSYTIDENGTTPAAILCPPDTYGPGLRKQRGCVSCPPFYTTKGRSAQTRMTSCVVPPGFYLEATGAAPCPKGEFKSEVGPGNCTKCPNGTTTVAEGATRTSDCIDPCAGYNETSININQTCLALMWSDVGCTRTDGILPAYSTEPWWLNSTKLNISVDMQKWALNGSDEYRSGCYKACVNTTCAAAGKGSCGPVTGGCTDPCGGYTNASTGVSEACLAQMWSDVGCTRTDGILPEYATEPWWLNSTKLNISVDMQKWAVNGSDEYRSGCYKTCNNTTCAAAGKGSCDPVTGGCTDPCGGYTNASRGASAACLFQMWSDVGCTRTDGILPAYSTEPWWLNSTKPNINADMQKWALNGSDEYRSGCYKTCINTTCAAAGKGSCDPVTGGCTDPCGGYTNASTGVSAACLAQMWSDVGCTRTDSVLPAYSTEPWWLNSTKLSISADMLKWAFNGSDEYRSGCYKACVNTTCAAAGKGSCDPVTGGCSDPCGGYTNASTGVSAACLAQMWAVVGCTRTDGILPAYSRDAWWLNSTKLNISVDMQKWALNGSDEYRSGCYKACINTTCAAAGKGSCDPVTGSCTANVTDPCGGYTNASSGVSAACLAQMWSDVGCTRTDGILPAYSTEPWWLNSTKLNISADMQKWALNGSDEYRSGCYKACINTTCAGAGKGSCDPVTGGCTDPCGGYTNASTSVSAACLAQMWSDVGCTRTDGILPGYSREPWWLNSSKLNISVDMQKWALNGTDEYRSGCYKACVNTTCAGAGKGSCDPVTGGCAAANVTDPCGGYTNASTGVSAACLAQMWSDMGCTRTDAVLPAYSREPWWLNSSKLNISADMQKWALNGGDEYRSGCYKTCINTTCAAAGKGSCNPVTGGCSDPCGGYTNASTGVSAACLAQMWSDMGCTRTDGILPGYSTEPWWLNSSKLNISADMQKWALNGSDEYRSGCYKACINTTCAAAGKGSCDPSTGGCTDPCGGYTNASTSVSAACLAQMWSDVGCTRTDGILPAYSRDAWWLNSTKLSISADMQKWALNGSDEYRNGCYKACINTTCAAAGKGSCDPVTGSCTDPCGGYTNGSTGVSAACLAQMWSDVGCTRTDSVLPAYSTEPWWLNNTKLNISADMQKWAFNGSDEYRSGCYKACINTTCAAAGKGSCNPVTGGCTDPCGGYTNASTSVSAACLAQMWSDVGCTRTDGILPAYSTEPWWLNSTKLNIGADMQKWALTGSDEYRSGCYKACINTTCAAAGKGSCDPATGSCTANVTDPCGGYTNASTGVSAACLAQMWSDVGCTRTDGILPAYSTEPWWLNSTKRNISADIQKWALNGSDEYRSGCYKACINTTCAAAGKGSCDPVTGGCTDPCGGYTNASMGVSAACLAQMWSDVGCTRTDGILPAYSTEPWWLNNTKLNISADMQKWALNGSDEYRSGCYKACINTTCAASGNGSCDPVTGGCSIPITNVTDPCGGYTNASTGVSAACLAQMWSDVGCTRTDAILPAYSKEPWWLNNTKLNISADMQKWALNGGDEYRSGCYKACINTTCAAAGNGSCDPVTGGCTANVTNPCGGYTNTSTGVSAACLAQMWADVGCTRTEGILPAYSTESWWLNSTKLNISVDMQKWAVNTTDTYRSGCYTACINTTCVASGKGSCNPTTGNCTSLSSLTIQPLKYVRKGHVQLQQSPSVTGSEARLRRFDVHP